MMNLPRMNRRAFVCGLLAFTALWHTAFAQDAAPRPIRILTIGNSFADDGVRFLRGFGTAAGQEIVIGRANLSGSPMDRHVNFARIFDENPEDPKGRPYKSKFLPPRIGDTKMYSLREMLEAEKWDYVTIQQVSAKSFDFNTYEPHAGFLVDYIHKYAPQAEILIHQTWAYRDDHAFFGRTGGPATQKEMYDGLIAAYGRLAGKYGFRVIPSGFTLQKARATERWTYVYPDREFDYKNPPAEAAPKQPGSLNVGWYWGADIKTGERKFILDPIHLNTPGCYLAGAVWFEKLTGRSVVENTFLPDNLDAKDAEQLRRIAHDAVVEFDRTAKAASTAAIP